MGYPVVLNIQDKSAVVIGGGKIATRKVVSLVKAHAVVSVISPRITEELYLLANKQKIIWYKKIFESTDINDSFIVIAATNVPEVNLAVYEAGKDKLINIVDHPHLCSFHVPAVFERGSLSLSISTGGASPSLAKSIKHKLGQVFEESYEQYVTFLERSRPIVFEMIKEKEVRKKIFSHLTSDEFYRSGNWEKNFHQLLLEMDQ